MGNDAQAGPRPRSVVRVQPTFPVQNRAPAGAVRPSPIFLVVVAATVVGAWLCATQAVEAGVAVFVFVVAGWILSLILHEFAHAFVAWRGGDHSIPARGYLTLDPRRYTDPITSIALPLLFVVMGGFGLPGGAVWINRAALRSRSRASLVSLAGPSVNLAVAAACFVPLSAGVVGPDRPVLEVGLAFLGFLQVAAFVLNILPFPGLDGFGALEPYLPAPLLKALAPIRQWGLLILIGVLFYFQPANRLFWDTILSIIDAFSVNQDLVRQGFRLFRFWE